jgi:hypothetical protein
MRAKWFTLTVLCVFLVAILAGCGGGPPTSTPTPTPSPTKTTKPEIVSAIAGARTLQSGDAIQPATVVNFTGQGPADAVIRVYSGATLIGTVTTNAAGAFNFPWTAGATEGTTTLQFTAKKPDLDESDPVAFTLVIDGTGPSIVSGSAKADAPGGTPPVITIVFNEPLVVSDMTQFTLVPSPYFTIVLGGPGLFNLSQISLGADKKTVTLTGTALTDQLTAGIAVLVQFVTFGPLTVTDQAGNPCVLPAQITFTVSP